MVGQIAVDQDPLATVYDNKRFVGQHFDQIQRYIDNYPFKMTKDPKSKYASYDHH